MAGVTTPKRRILIVGLAGLTLFALTAAGWTVISAIGASSSDSILRSLAATLVLLVMAWYTATAKVWPVVSKWLQAGGPAATQS